MDPVSGEYAQITAAAQNGWIDGGNQETLQATDLPGHLNTLAAAIADTDAPRVYLHCSAGIHRTGFFAYLVLRMGGRSPA